MSGDEQTPRRGGRSNILDPHALAHSYNGGLSRPEMAETFQCEPWKISDSLNRDFGITRPFQHRISPGGAVCSTLAQADDVQVPATTPESELHTRARSGDVASVQRLLDTGIPVDDPDTAGDTALHLAADRGHLEVVKRLLLSGADMQATNLAGETPLDHANLNDHEQVCQELRQAGSQGPAESSSAAAAADTSQ